MDKLESDGVKKNTGRNKYLELFLVFLKIGAFTFGGGYAMIPFIRREIVENRGWLKEDEILDIIAVAEATPGPMAVNSATFVGYRIGGFLGALIATTGVVLPSFVIISLLTNILILVESNRIVNSAFAGIRVGVLVLLVGSLISLFRSLKKDAFSVTVLIVAFGLVVAFGYLIHISTVYVLVFCAVIGIIRQLLTCRKESR